MARPIKWANSPVPIFPAVINIYLERELYRNNEGRWQILVLHICRNGNGFMGVEVIRLARVQNPQACAQFRGIKYEDTFQEHIRFIKKYQVDQ
jgi:hypothetical protein